MGKQALKLISLACAIGLAGCTTAVPKPEIQTVTVAKCIKENSDSKVTIQANWLSFRYKDAETSIVKDLGVPYVEATYRDHVQVQGNKLVASKDSSFIPEVLGFNVSYALLAPDAIVLDGEKDQAALDQKIYNCDVGAINSVIQEYKAFDEYIKNWNANH